MRIEVSTRAERSIPWMDESPPTRGDQIYHDGEILEVTQVRWNLDRGVCCVLVHPVGAMFDVEVK